MNDRIHGNGPGDLADKQEIHELVLRYFRGIDRLDLDLVRSCYHPDATDTHPGFTGTRDEYVTWVGEALTTLAGCMHLVGNHLVELDGDHAEGESYCTAFHWRHVPEGEPAGFTSGLRYLDRYERRDGTWRIRQRVVVREWMRTEPHLTPERGPGVDEGHRRRTLGEHLGPPSG